MGRKWALPWVALRAPLGVAPGGYAWFPPIALTARSTLTERVYPGLAHGIGN